MAERTLVSDLDKTLHLADIADEITMRHYGNLSLNVESKPDMSPVSDGDLEVDRALRQIIENDFGDNCLSEESSQEHHTGRVWVLDPIDGTKNFIRRHPVWATLISIQDESGTLAAAVSAPALGRRWWAARGEGAWTRDVDGSVRQIHVSKVAKLGDAYLTYCSLLPWDDTPVGVNGILQLMRSVWRERSPGDALGHVYVAEGVVDACIEPNTKEWDMAAHAFIIEEAGGSVHTPDPRTLPAAAQRLIITSNGLLEDQLKHALGE